MRFTPTNVTYSAKDGVGLMKRSIVLSLALLALSAGFLHAQSTQGQQHYLAYHLKIPSFKITQVLLTDQFLKGRFSVLEPLWLLNPVTKQVANSQGFIQTFPITRPELHYLAHGVKMIDPATFPGTSVYIDNQFEKAKIKVANPSFLLAPAAKELVNPGTTSNLTIPDANHFLCYDVERQPIQVRVGLADQFQQRQMVAVERAHLCNPTIKKHKGQIFSANTVGPDNHLVCYRVLDPSTTAYNVLVKDQFVTSFGSAFGEEELCVPTRKTCTSLQTPHVDTLVYTGSSPSDPTQTGLRIRSLSMRIRESPTLQTIDSFFDVFTELTVEDQSGHTRDLALQGRLATSNSIGDPDFDLLRLQLNPPPAGDPDFDLLRIRAGTDFGMPSPGHTTLTRQQDGTWAVDSFFDIEYRIDFKTTPTSSFGGIRGSTTATIRMQAMCPAVNP